MAKLGEKISDMGAREERREREWEGRMRELEGVLAKLSGVAGRVGGAENMEEPPHQLMTEGIVEAAVCEAAVEGGS